MAATAIAVAAGLASAGASAADPSSPAPTPSASPAPSDPPATPAPPPSDSATPPPGAAPTPPPGGPKSTIDQPGTYKVGTDIVAGTYATAGPLEGSACYWKRVGGEDGQTTVDNALSKKPQVVQIDPTDTAFKTDGCQPWQLTDAQPPNAAGPLMSQLQLRHYLDQLNGLAGQSGNGQLPPY
ncbi:hypothetical protein B1R94_13140 [Mycolicibacterium litorale]|nr:hypothetical protein B1R94_13140 [Mycolicibacterium litorale]